MQSDEDRVLQFTGQKKINVQFCSNLSSASAGSRLALSRTHQFTDLFNVFDSHNSA